jgi:protease-3
MWDNVARLTQKSSWTNAELLLAAKKVSPNDLTNYYLAIKNGPLLRIFASGNYSEETLKSIAQDAAAILPGHRLPAERALQRFDIPQHGKWKLFSDSVDLEDSGVLITWFGERGTDAEWAEMQVLDGLFYPAVYTQLRTNEQLGYIVDGGYLPIADTLCFFIAVQSANSDLTKIKARIDNFRKSYFDKLKLVDESEIEKIKQAKIANLIQKPTDFNVEASQYAHEFWRARYKFDERDRHIAALKKVDKAALISLYEKLLLNDKSSGVYVQLRGTNFKDASFSSLK